MIQSVTAETHQLRGFKRLGCHKGTGITDGAAIASGWCGRRDIIQLVLSTGLKSHHGCAVTCTPSTRRNRPGSRYRPLAFVNLQSWFHPQARVCQPAHSVRPGHVVGPAHCDAWLDVRHGSSQAYERKVKLRYSRMFWYLFPL